jgi:hypothetical protein
MSLSQISDYIQYKNLLNKHEYPLLKISYDIIINIKKQIPMKSKNYKFDYYDDNLKEIISYIYKIYYNDYLKYNYDSFNLNENVIQKFISKNDEFIKSLTVAEIFTIKYYTYHGDILLNLYIQHKKNASFSKDLIIDCIHDYCGNIKDEDTDICLFYYQFKQIFEDDIYDEEYFIANYENLSTNDYCKIFELYMNDLNLIFEKAPKTDEIIWLYRGVNSISSLLTKNDQYLSSSVFLQTAYKYTAKKNRQIIRIEVNIGTPLLFVQGISLAKEEYDFEVIIPINMTFTIKPDTTSIIFNKNAAKEYICIEDYDKTDEIIITDVKLE